MWPGSAPHWGCGGRRFKSGHPTKSINVLFRSDEGIKDIFPFFNNELFFCFRISSTLSGVFFQKSQIFEYLYSFHNSWLKNQEFRYKKKAILLR